jgi:large subunit ribosomal protein L10
MVAASEAKVAQWKRDLVGELKEKFEGYPVVGILDVSDIPARQFQQMRRMLREKAEIKVGRKVLLRIAAEQAGEKKQELRELTKYLEGQVALIFTQMNPFKLWKFLNENRATAPAKPGQAAPKDIVIPAGDTDFPPGPIIGELQRVGIKARIQAGKIVILEDCTLLKEGDIIKPEVAEALSKFGIEPREIGFKLLAAFEGGVVFPGDVLVVDEEKVKGQIQMAYTHSLNLSVEVGYPTGENVRLLISKASARAFALALNASIPTTEVLPHLLGRASIEMRGLATALVSKDVNALDDELRKMVSAPEHETKKEAKPEEKPKREEEKGEKEEKEKEETAGLGALFG